MPTRAGRRSLVLAVVLALGGRTFAAAEASAIAVAIFAAVAISVVAIRIRPLRLHATRRIEPIRVHVGQRARSFLEITNTSRWRNPAVRCRDSTRIPPLRRSAPMVITEDLDTSRRGPLTLAPVDLVRADPLGLAARTLRLRPREELMVLPRFVEVPMPSMGVGILGDLLLRTAQRLGLGEFDGLREYVDGDDWRAIHWKASSRSEELMVREFTVEGAKRCTVVLDRDALAVATSGPGAFEVAVEIAATLVVSAENAGLATRLVIPGLTSLAGPSISADAIAALTLVTPGPALTRVERDGSEGLGLLIIVSPAAEFPADRARELTGDRSMVPIRVLTGGADHHPRTSPSTEIHCEDLEGFSTRWTQMLGGAR